VQEGKCWDTVEKEMKLPKYAGTPGYEQALPFILRRYCGLWGPRQRFRGGSEHPRFRAVADYNISPHRNAAIMIMIESFNKLFGSGAK
jgi:hypothetical protein